MPEEVISMIPPARINALIELCGEVVIPGSVIEVGVYRGGSAIRLVHAFPERQIYLADTFTGIPYDRKEGHHHKGLFGDVDFQAVQDLFAPYPNVKLLQGIFPNAFMDLLDQGHFAFVHLDCDMWESYLLSLGFLYPRTEKGGMIVFDDYMIGSAPGATLAVNTFMGGKEPLREYKQEYYIVKEAAWGV